MGVTFGGRCCDSRATLSRKLGHLPGRTGSEYHSEIVDYVNWDDTLFTVPVGSTIRDETDPADVQGVHVHVYNPDDPHDDHWFWVWTYSVLDWNQWDDVVAGNMEMHNMALA